MQNNNSWDRYEIYVVETLAELKDRIEKLDIFIRAHMEREEERLEELDKRLFSLEKDQKWHARIAATIGSGIAIVIGWLT